MAAAPPLPASLGPVLEFMRSLWALDHALSERARDVGSRFGITATQRLVIRILGQSPGTSAGAVARLLHIRPSTLTPVLQQLASRGLIRRAADPLDRRRLVLWLTARGERVDRASAVHVDEQIRAALARVAPSEVFHARRVMSAIAEALGELPARPAQRRPPRRGKKKAPAAPLTLSPAGAGIEPQGEAIAAEAIPPRRSSGP